MGVVLGILVLYTTLWGGAEDMPAHPFNTQSYFIVTNRVNL